MRESAKIQGAAAAATGSAEERDLLERVRTLGARGAN